jgi:hypothetical protein
MMNQYAIDRSEELARALESIAQEVRHQGELPPYYVRGYRYDPFRPALEDMILRSTLRELGYTVPGENDETKV